MKTLKIYLTLFLLSLFVLFSCISDDKPMIETIISIDLSNNEQLKLSQVFRDKIEYIALESPEEHLFKETSKVEIYNNLILIADYYTTSSLFVFNREGRFISQISPQGWGPCKDETLEDFYFDESNQEIGLFSHSGKLVIYDIIGNELRQKSLGVRAGKYQLMGDKIFLSGMDSDHWLHILHCNGTEVGKFIPVDNKIGLGFGPYNSFSGTKDSVLFLPSLHQVIYCYTNGRVFPKYVIDFGQHNVPNQVWETSKNFDDYIIQCQENHYAWQINYFFETKGYLHFYYRFDKKSYFAFYNRATKEIYNSCDVLNDIDGIDYWGAMGQIEDGIIYARYPYYIKKNLEHIKSILSTEEWVEFQSKNKELCEIGIRAKNADNPILIIYTYK